MSMRTYTMSMFTYTMEFGATTNRLHSVHTKDSAGILVKRRLSVFRSLIKEVEMHVTRQFTPTHLNIADVLTRLMVSPLTQSTISSSTMVSTPARSNIDLRTLHDMHHPSIERSLKLDQLVHT
ncbi:hypothetical protein GJ496_001225 [Pomphorhynchus laevis]|nr:hypothetical protein GJ496_001225 [Pomphorhynchus laevis]